MQFLNHLEINENQTKKQKLYLATAAGYTPTGGEGNLIYDTSDDLLKYWDGSQWITLMNSTGGATYTIQTYVAGGYNNEVGFRLLGSNGTTDEIRFVGTTNETTVTNQASPNGIVIGLPDDVTITNNLTVGNDTVITGNLTVNGTTTTVNSNTVSVGDNIIELNADLSSGTAPSQDAGILVNRGSATDVQLRYNETGNYWEFTNDGTTFCAIPCLSSGTSVLSYLKHYVDDGSSHSPANSIDNIVFVGGTCIKTSTGTSTVPGGTTDAIIIDHEPLTNATNVFADHDSTFSQTLNWGGAFYGAQLHFDGCGHRTRNYTYEYTLPAAPTTYPDQNIFERFMAQNTNDAGSTTSAVGGIQIADSTQDTMIFRGLDSSIHMDTATDDVLTVKSAVRVIYAVIAKDDLILDGGMYRATINHAFGTDNLVVELWEMHDSPAQARHQVHADVSQEAHAGTPSTNHVTVKFSQKPSTDIKVVIHSNNNTNEVTPQYS
tara:strand:+ start:2307 stop:3776 length:1470 start_codon:yes stop_codon:yes gene_type:complete